MMCRRVFSARIFALLTDYRAKVLLLGRFGRRTVALPVLLAFVSAIPSVIAQQKKVSDRVGGDPQAIAVVEHSMAALSERGSWGRVKAIHLTGSMSTPQSNGPRVESIEWKDRWDGNNIWSSHRMGQGDSERTLLQSPGQGRQMQHSSNAAVRIRNSETRPPIEIPGAYLSAVLNDASCMILSASTATSGQNDDEQPLTVHIFCADSESAMIGKPQIWQFSRSTYLPLSVAVSRQNQARAGGWFTETTRFKNYRSVDGLKVPESSEIELGAIRRTLTLHTIEFPDAGKMNKTEFEVRKAK